MTAILGGGISGLSAAYYALQYPKISPVTVIEAADRVGGWIKTCKSSNGAVFEKGPRTIRSATIAGRNALNLVDNLELTDKIIAIPSTHPCAKNRFIYVNKKLHILPNSIFSMFKITSPFKRPLIMSIFNDWRAPKITKDDESVYSFVERRLGKDVADYLISPMICGIYAGDAQKLSVKSLFESFFEAEQNHGSIFRGLIKKGKGEIQGSVKNPNQESRGHSAKQSLVQKWSAWSLKDGLEQIPQLLAKNLSACSTNIRLNSRCERIKFTPDGVEIQVNGEKENYSNLISSLPAKQLGMLVHHQHPELAQELAAIPTVTVGVVNFEFKNDTILPMEAFGFLVPPSEKLPILGVIFDSCIIPHKSSTVLTVMMGGAWFESWFGKNPTENHLQSVALEQVQNILKIKESPCDVSVSILRDCIPQYVIGHCKRLDRIQEYISSRKIPMTLCGSSYHGIGFNDVILSAKKAIEAISSKNEE